MTQSKDLLFSFGVVTDIQYADVDDRMNPFNTNWRRYRNSLQVLPLTVNYWNHQHPSKVQFVLQLGDIVDRHNITAKSSDIALGKVLRELQRYNGKLHHVWGNHDLENFQRSTLTKNELKPCLPHGDMETDNGASFYHFAPHDEVLFIMLDTYQIGLFGYPENHPNVLRSKVILESAESPRRGIDRRLVSCNGALGEDQLQWLDDTLKTSQQNPNQKVIVCGHQPLYEASSLAMCMCWNYEAVLGVLHKYACVQAYLCGHYHDGGYGQDSYGLHHLTLPAVLEAHPGTCDFATIDVYHHKMVLKGSGRVVDRTLHFK